MNENKIILSLKQRCGGDKHDESTTKVNKIALGSWNDEGVQNFTGTFAFGTDDKFQKQEL